MDNYQLILSLGLTITALLFLLWMVRSFAKEFRTKYDQMASSELEAIIQHISGNIRDYHFFTTGHPYVWVETTLKEMETAIKATTVRYGPDGSVWYQPPRYALKIDDHRKAVYYIPNIKSFDFSKLMHYQEWLDSQKEVAANIAQHKQEHS